MWTRNPDTAKTQIPVQKLEVNHLDHLDLMPQPQHNGQKQSDKW